MNHPGSVTFRTLAERDGIVLPDPLPQEWPLEVWFASVCDLPIEEFTVFDLARSCRQQIDVDAVMPYCLRELERTPLAGELYDGELLAAVVCLPADYWIACLQQRDALVTICHAALLEMEDAKLQAQIEGWLAQQKQRKE